MFKWIIAQVANHGIPCIVLLDYFYTSHFSINKILLDQLIPRQIGQLPYVMIVQLLDHMDNAKQQLEKNAMLVELRT